MTIYTQKQRDNNMTDNENTIKLLNEFAYFVLNTLEARKDWNSDFLTLEEIAIKAHDLGLAHTDIFGDFEAIKP